MYFEFRKICGAYLEMVATDGNASIVSGTMNEAEAKELLDNFKSAIEDIEWFLNGVAK